MIAIPKPMKPPGEAKSYRPMSLLCVPFKIMERLTYARIESIVDPLLPQEQAGNGAQSRLLCLKNGVPRGSVLTSPFSHLHP